MADFDPDAYLAATEPTPTATPEFDPDEYLKATAPKPKTGVEAATSYGQTLGAPTIEEQTKMVEAIPEPIRKPLEAAAETVSGFIPKTPKEIAGFATPVVGAIETIASTPKKLSDVLFGGKSVAEAFPESQLLAEAERTPAFSKERYKAGFEVLGTLGMGAAIGRGLIQPKLSETLGFEKPETPLPTASELTPEVAAVNEGLAKLEQRPSELQNPRFNLLGSRGRGDATATSDYDVSTKLTPEEYQAWVNTPEGDFPNIPQDIKNAAFAGHDVFIETPEGHAYKVEPHPVYEGNHVVVERVSQIEKNLLSQGKKPQGVPNAIQEPVSTQPYGVRAEPQVPQETQAPAASVGSERVPEIRQGAEVPGGTGQEVAPETGSGPVSDQQLGRIQDKEVRIINTLAKAGDPDPNGTLLAITEGRNLTPDQYEAGLDTMLQRVAPKALKDTGSGPVSPTVHLADWKKGGFKELPAVYLRFGDLPKGKSGKYLEGKRVGEEPGISVVKAWKDPETGKYVIRTTGTEDVEGIEGIANRKIHEVSGKEMQDVGSDEEPLLEAGSAKSIKEVHPGQITTDELHSIALDGTEWSEKEIPDWIKTDTGTQPVQPKLLSGEKQGDIISSTQQEPFALVGEKAAPGTHPTEIAETTAKTQAAEEARLKSEYEQGLLSDVEEHQARGGDELVDVLKSHGLPLTSKATQYARELNNVREMFASIGSKTGRKGFGNLVTGTGEKLGYQDVFKQGGGSLDSLTSTLRNKGFDVDTPNDTLNLIQQRLGTGKKVFGNEARAEAADWTGATALKPFQPQTEGGFLGSTSGTFKSIAIKKRTPLDAATGQRSERLQKSFTEAERAQKEIRKVAPTDRRQNAISVWMEAGGDMATIDQWAVAAKGKMFKRAAEDAKNLSPQEIAIAQKARAAFDVLEGRGNQYDVLNAHRDNYVPHVWDVNKKFTGIGSSKLQDRFKFAKARAFENFFEGDQAGFTPKTMAIGKVLPAYIHEMNRVIADRQFVQDVSDMTASDKRPLVIPRGNAKTVDTTDYIVRDANGNPLPRFQKSVYETQADAQAALKPGQIIEKRPSSSALVNPRGFAKAEDAKGNPIDQRDYKVVDQPALNNWRWVETDPQGGTTILKSDLAVHPELAKRLNAMTGQSAIKQWYNEPSSGLSVIPKAIVKGLDTAQSVMKREMFGLLAPFHQVQEGTHAIGHTINPTSFIPSVERLTPAQLDAIQNGLMALPERHSSQSYVEGVGGQHSFIPQLSRWLGEKSGQNVVGKALTTVADVIDGYQDFLFHKYIPGLKFKTYDHILPRNMERYAPELKRGEVTQSDVKMLSAIQTNAAYGHLNYALMDRNPTIQHLLQVGLLAPDFLEARARFTGQALKTLAGEKAGSEQFRAIAVLAASQAGVMYTLAHVLGGEWDWKHPFEMTLRGRRYMLRSVPEDLHRLFFQGPDVRREFISARVNPAAQKIDQLRTGLNYRGEKTGALETIGELLANYIPITARWIPGVRNLTETSRNNPVSPLEQLAGSLGLKISRYSPITKTHQLAAEWMDKKGIARDRGSYPVSKFQQLRYALEDGDLDRARGEWEKLAKGGDKSKLAKGFQQSINHPFTGSIKSDAEFAASLDKPNRMIFDHAKEVRKGIMFKFHSIYSGPFGKPKKNVGAAPYVP